MEMATVEQVLQTNKNTVQAIYKKLENMYMYVCDCASTLPVQES